MKKYLFAIVGLLACITSFSQNLNPQVNKKGLWGYVNEKGKYAIKPSFQEAFPFDANNLAIIKTGDKYGFINKSGACIIPPVYESAEPHYMGCAKCQKGGKLGLIALDGTEKIPFKYSELELNTTKKYYLGKVDGASYTHIITINDLVTYEYDSIDYDKQSDELIPVSKGNLIGFMDSEGKQVCVPKYTEISSFNYFGVAIAKMSSGHGLLTRNRLNGITSFVNPKVELVGMYFILEKSDGSYTMYSPQGNEIIADATDISQNNNEFIITQNDIQMLLSNNSDILFSKCENIVYDDGIYVAIKDKATYKYDSSTKKMAVVINNKDIWTPVASTDIEKKGNIILWKDVNGNQKIMSTTGAPMFASKGEFRVLSSNCFSIKENGGYNLYNASEQKIAGPFDSIYPLDDNHVVIVKPVGRERRGAIVNDQSGKMLTDFIFTNLTMDRQGNIFCQAGQLAASGDKVFVLKDDHYGDVYAAVDASNKKYGLFNKKENKVIVSGKYDEIYNIDDLGNAYTFIQGKGYGLLSVKGTTVLSNIYLNEPVRIANAQHYVVYDNYGGAFYIDATGKKVSATTVEKFIYQNERNVGF